MMNGAGGARIPCFPRGMQHWVETRIGVCGTMAGLRNPPYGFWLWGGVFGKNVHGDDDAGDE